MNIFISCENMDGVTNAPVVHHLADLNIKGISLSIEAGSHLLNCTFTDCKFGDQMSGIYTDRTKFVRCTFYDVNFVGCDFIGAEFTDCEFYNCKSISSTTCQQDMGDLFSLVEIPQEDGDTSYPDDREMDYHSYSTDHTIVSGTRYATSF